MIELGVMYSDLSIQWEPLDRISNINREDTLFLTLTSERGNRKAIISRAYGTDFYGLRVTEQYIHLWGWDEQDLYFYMKEIINPSAGVIKIKKENFIPEDTIIFIGAYVEPDEWERALKLAEKVMF